MGMLTCSRCKAKTETNSVEEGRKRLDHSVGLFKGKPCEDGKATLYFTGKKSKPKNKPKTETSKSNVGNKPKKDSISKD